jgi:hypothetical protein
MGTDQRGGLSEKLAVYCSRASWLIPSVSPGMSSARITFFLLRVEEVAFTTSGSTPAIRRLRRGGAPVVRPR